MPDAPSQNSLVSRPHAQRAVAAVVLVAVILTLAPLIFTARLSHDEHMYLSAAHLLGDNALYKDFAYFQTPYMPYVYHWALLIPGADHVLTTARLVKLFVVALLILSVFIVCFRMTGDRWLALACVLLLSGNDIFRHAIPYATNHDMASLLTVAAFAVAIRFDSKKRPIISTVVCGILVGLAIGTKLTFVLVPLCFLVPIVAVFGVSSRGLNSLFLFAGGLVVSLIPAAFIFARAGIDSTVFNNIGYHQLNAVWRVQSGFDHPMTLPEKFYFARMQLLELSSALLLIAAAGLSIIRIRTGFPVSVSREPAVFAFVLFVPTCVAMFLIPTPIWRAYFSPFVISVVLFTAALYSELTPNVRRQARLALWVCALAIVAINIRADMGRIGATFEPDRWMGEEIHRRGQLLRSAVPQDARGRPVATLSPVYALEAGLPIYPELATGQFAFRIGGLLSAEEIRLYRTASTATLESLLDREPPSAVFIGFADGQDSTLVEYARKRGFVKHTVVPRRADVWVGRSERNRLESRSEISE